MQQKFFIVVELPKDENGFPTINETPAPFEQYDKAFDALQDAAGKEVNPVRGENPVRVELEDRVLELWVVTRNAS